MMMPRARPPPSARRRSTTGRARVAPASFRESRVTFEGVDGELLVGTLRAPAADHGSSDANEPNANAPALVRPIALLAHGYMSSRNTGVLLRLADALEQRLGMASLRWDFSGNGESAGRFRYGGYRREAREIAAAAAWARATGRFRVALLAGHSKGATSALVYAGGSGGGGGKDEHDAQDDAATLPPPSPLHVVNIAGRFDVREGVERRLGPRALDALAEKGRVDGMPGRRGGGAGGGPPEPFEWTLYREDLEDRLSTDVGHYCAAARRKGSARVLSLHCEGDAEVPCREASRFHEALGGDAAGHRLVLLPGGDHSFRGAGPAEALVDEVVTWAAVVEVAEG